MTNSQVVYFEEIYSKFVGNCFNLYWPFGACYPHGKEHQDPPTDG